MLPRPAFRSAVTCLLLSLLLVGAAPKPAQVSTHEQAARELARMIGTESIAGPEAMMGIFFQGSEMAADKEVFRAWYQKVLAESDVESEMVKLYMEAFSEKELREIIAFYKTPTGRRVLATMPELMQRAAEVGMKRAPEYAEELDEMLDKAREERENEPAADDAAAQKRTVAQIRNTGTAMFSWLTDQVGAAAAGQSQTEPALETVELKHYPLVSREQLEKILVPNYIQKVPVTDGWGNPFEYYLNTANPMAPQVMGIRSPGRDGKFSAASYTVGPFDPDELDEDIVWTDGFFVRWPQAQDR